MLNGAEKIRFMAFDFDGVFTDNHVYVDENGKETVCCSRYDGIGLEKIREFNIGLIVISKEKNPVVEKRCTKLKLKCISGCEDKLTALKKVLEENKISPEFAAFIGNDLPDIECMKYVGYPIAIKNSAKEVYKVAKYTTKVDGGHGAVREICDLIYEKRMRLKK